LKDLPPSVIKLVSPETGAEVYIVGTAHVSQKSVDDVTAVISKVVPDTVMIELCRARVAILSQHPKFNKEAKKPDAKNEVSLLQIYLKHRRDGSNALKNVLAEFTRRVSSQLEVVPGAEFVVAAQAAAAIKAAVILGDRPIEITLKRAWVGLTMWQKIKLLYEVVKLSVTDISADDIEKLKNKDLLSEVIKECTAQFPGLAIPLIEERDAFLCHSLRTCPGKVIVGVVGMGHVPGIHARWSQPLPDRKALLEMPQTPPKKPWLKRIVVWGSVGAAAAAVVYWFM
jgi:pheromone shutdown protein TraB